MRLDANINLQNETHHQGIYQCNKIMITRMPILVASIHLYICKEARKISKEKVIVVQYEIQKWLGGGKVRLMIVLHTTHRRRDQYKTQEWVHLYSVRRIRHSCLRVERNFWGKNLLTILKIWKYFLQKTKRKRTEKNSYEEQSISQSHSSFVFLSCTI